MGDIQSTGGARRRCGPRMVAENPPEMASAPAAITSRAGTPVGQSSANLIFSVTARDHDAVGVAWRRDHLDPEPPRSKTVVPRTCNRPRRIVSPGATWRLSDRESNIFSSRAAPSPPCPTRSARPGGETVFREADGLQDKHRRSRSRRTPAQINRIPVVPSDGVGRASPAQSGSRPTLRFVEHGQAAEPIRERRRVCRWIVIIRACRKRSRRMLSMDGPSTYRSCPQ
jgi:hypothetical protein